jgi:ribosome-associated protein
MDFDFQSLLSEAVLKFTRSSGKGGQNVNKVSSKAQLYFDVKASVILSEEQKETLLEKFSNQTSDEGVLKITASEARTQLENKEAVKEKFIALLKKAFHKKKKRVATKIPRQVVEKRLTEKKKAGELKKLRKKVS